MAVDQTTYGASVYGDDLYSPYRLAPDPLPDAETTGPAVLAQALSATPASITDTDQVGTGGTTPGSVTPTSLIDAQTLGAPVPAKPTNYGAGLYSTGTYSGATQAAPTSVAPDSLIDGETVHTSQDPVAGSGYGAGEYGSGRYTGLNTPGTAGIIDTEQLGQPALSGTAAPDGGYGAGAYGSNLYAGTLVPSPDDATHLPTPPIVKTYPDPMHILGIGPWSPVKVWRGAINYGIGRGIQPARPQMQLPGIQSKSFTLRLNAGCEATVSVQTARRDAIIVEEMVTDLWWRRRDPRTGKLEMIGRFNCSHNDLSRADDGTLQSALQFQDYRLVVANRLVMQYKDTQTVTTSTTTDTYSNGDAVATYNTPGTKTVLKQTQWPKGTPVTQIMRWFMPDDMGLDLSLLEDDLLLGVTTIPFHLPLGNTIDDAMSALFDASEKAWEWWVDTPIDVTAPPRVMAQYGYRGVDKGVTLFDYGTGPTPIAGWNLRATSDTYANTLYFQGKDGGCVVDIPAQVAQYGRRDAQASDNSIQGDIANYARAAYRKLSLLADRRPTFTVNLKAGFWRGRNHIDVGDLIRLRVKLGGELLAYEYRVTEIQVDIDTNGAETVALTLGPPLASANPRSQYSPLFRFRRALANYETPSGAEDVVVVSPTFSQTFGRT